MRSTNIYKNYIEVIGNQTTSRKFTDINCKDLILIIINYTLYVDMLSNVENGL